MTELSAVELSRDPHRSTGPAMAGLLGLTLLIIGATWLSIAHTRVQDGVASVWIANGVLVGVMLMASRRAWMRVLLAGTVAMVLTRSAYGDSAGSVLWLTAANLVECLIVAGGIRHFVPDIREPAALPRLARVAVTSTLVGSVVSASLATLWFFSQSSGLLAQVWSTWFSAHLLGMVITATMTVTAMRLRWRVLGHAGRRLDLAACLGVLVLTCLLVGYQHRLPVLFLAYLPLMLVTYRHGFAGVVSGIAVLSVAGGIGAGLDIGPFDLVEGQSASARSLLLQVFIGAACLLIFPFAVALAERRRLATRMARSEGRYRLLADHSRDLIVRMDAAGRRLYVSPSARLLLGWEPAELMASHRDMVHPDDRDRVDAELQRLFKEGGNAVTTYRFQRRDGSYVWIEAVAQRVDAVVPPEVVYSGRDVTARIDAEQALAASREQLEAVADNMPAMIARFDRQERITYANATVGRVLGLAPEEILGRTLREVRGAAIYAEMAGHVAGVLAGQGQTFEGQAIIHGRLRDHSTRFVPDRGADGEVRGFYSLSSDITALKQAERELERLARFDALTGLPNRRHFDESLQEVCVRAQRNGRPLMLLALDLDNFKGINDTHGHSVGDAVLRAFATRIRDCAYEVDLPARLGGDEFVVLMEYSPEAEVGAVLANRILKAMREPIQVGDLSVTVSPSIGIGIVQRVRACERLLELADAALYDAKSAGRNAWRLRSE